MIIAAFVAVGVGIYYLHREIADPEEEVIFNENIEFALQRLAVDAFQTTTVRGVQNKFFPASLLSFMVDS